METVYEVALAHELRKRGLQVRRQVPIAIEFDGLKFDEGVRMDLLVEETVIVEIKSVEHNHRIHPKQLRTYLVLAKMQLGLCSKLRLGAHERLHNSNRQWPAGKPGPQK